MNYSKLVSLLATVAQISCASNDGSNSNPESSSAGGAGANSNGGTSLPDPGAAKALAETDCYVGLKTGNVTYTGAGCSGTSQDSSVSAIGPSSWDDIRVVIDIGLNRPPAIGKLDLASLTIQIPKADKTMSSWEAPIDACTATAKASATDDFMGWVYYLIDIACTKPAMPTTDLSLAPLPLSQFSIVTFFKA